MLYNPVIKIDTSKGMIHNICTSTLCLVLVLLVFMINNTLRNIATDSVHNSITTPSTTIIIGISMVNAIFHYIIVNTGISRCRTVVTTITITFVVIITSTTLIAINTIVIIITSTRLSLLLLLTFLINTSMSSDPSMTTITISIITHICVNSSDRSSATTTITVVMVGINIKFVTTNYS